MEVEFLEAALAPVPAALEDAFAAARAPVLGRAAAAAAAGDPLAGTRLERWLNESGAPGGGSDAGLGSGLCSPRGALENSGADALAARLATAAKARGAAAVVAARLNVACFREGKPRR